ncbi:hypothetical protein QYE76_064680 [Lolium multiflorum]|uniref:Mitochondrial inner membrane protease subunit 2 n=1 Tax=Lolium multiflorum TaxID=4521 RepID=A0AAD8S9F0_LOLMU|nr:hypothetical protein QYE76_064680 [Lolium multiflorum]
MAQVLAALRPIVNYCVGGTLVGLAISDRYFSLAAVHGSSMHPTFEDRTGEYALVQRSGLARYDFSRGEVVTFVSPVDHRSTLVKRLIGMPGDWISVPETLEIRKVPEGHCWLEGDNGSVSWDSRFYGPIPLGLVRGRVTHVVWPPHKFGRVDKRLPEGRVMPQRHF